ncbi:metallophosphoesterase family protein [Bacillus ginsengihumi]|uniref:Metallophosphoesterase family protein n=1 Tax=Heyndrickxia ginsengihumi TaxID=363870 RepID=A0A6M0P7S5_9BACI|nr:metallophosphoesterase family protein [Heyndrickxia ginsengihumi]NEY20742.1 metallophosphoesterase family protein [Heyndrickxia ginsengihumi]
MKIAFISDIHGNAVALEAVLEDIQLQKVDQIYVLGDICFRGPEPQRSLDLVRSLHTEVIKGNADEWVVRGIRKGEVPDSAYEIMNKERNWIVHHLTSEAIEYLQQLPTNLKVVHENISIHGFHATPISLFENIFPNASDEEIENKLLVEDADISLYAHIHKPYIRTINSKTIINLGSVGLPFDGIKKASYALVEVDQQFVQSSIRRVSFDVDKVINQFKQSDYPNKEKLIDILSRAKND